MKHVLLQNDGLACVYVHTNLALGVEEGGGGNASALPTKAD